MIVWDDSMSTGLPQIDAQHREIIGKFNELSEALTHSHAREVTEGILDFLQFYAAWHFGREEACMEQYRCPAAEANKHAHADFLKQFGQLYLHYQEEGVSSQLVQDTYDSLSNWIVAHIQQVDTQLYQCVKAAR